jgi:hypothetical protein
MPCIGLLIFEAGTAIWTGVEFRFTTGIAAWAGSAAGLAEQVDLTYQVCIADSTVTANVARIQLNLDFIKS